MKKITKCITGTLLALSLCATANAGISDGLIAYYPFNGNAHDESGNGHDGIEYGGVSYPQSSFGQAASFDGVDDRIALNSIYNNNNVLTVSLWATVGNNPFDYMSIYHTSDSSNDVSFSISYHKSRNSFYVARGVCGVVFPENYIYGAGDVVLGRTYNLTASIDHINNTMSFYIDGVLQGNTIYSSGNSICQYDDGEYIGGFSSYYQGVVDEVRIYNRALSVAEVQELYQMGTESNIAVDPTEYDFGEVAVGAPSTMYVNVANTGGSTLIVDDIYFQYAISGEPFTAEVPSLPLEIAANSSIDIPVSYSPSFLFVAQSNDLVIESDDADEAAVEVALTGTGVVATGDTPQAISSIQLYIDFAVETGTLVFTGDGDSGEAHYEALNNMLTSAGTSNNGCGNLQAAYKRVDGDSKQKDWVEGPATAGVAAAIQNAMNEMGCK